MHTIVAKIWLGMIALLISMSVTVASESPCDGLALRPGLPSSQQPFYGCVEKNAAMRAADEKFLAQVEQIGKTREQAAERAILRGWQFVRRGDMASAMRRFNQAWLLVPGNPDSLHGFAAVLASRDGNLLGAEVLFERAVSHPDAASMAWADYGRFMLIIGRTEEGIALLRKVLERDPKTPDVYMLLANGEYDRGDTAKACAYARKAMDRGDQLGAHLVSRFCGKTTPAETGSANR